MTTFVIAMKISGIILALYILCMALVPCDCFMHGANEDRYSDAPTEIYEHHNDHTDFCSPFCLMCFCHPVPALNISPLEVVLSNQTDIDTYSCFTGNTIYHHLYIANIWQPPKFQV